MTKRYTITVYDGANASDGLAMLSRWIHNHQSDPEEYPLTGCVI